MKQGKIMIMGGYGWSDIGDESMPMADIINLRKRVKKLDIVMLSPLPNDTNKFHKERAIYDLRELGLNNFDDQQEKKKLYSRTIQFLNAAHLRRKGKKIKTWKSADIFFDELETCDLLFNVGGGNINSIMPSELYKKCSIYLAAKILQKPIIISGQTMGPFLRRIDSTYVAFCLNYVDLITFRDNGKSIKRLQAIGVKNPIMLNTADDSITLPYINKQELIQIQQNDHPEFWEKDDSKLIIAMNMKGSLSQFTNLGKENNLDKECVLMSQMADYIIEKYNAKICFLPTDYSDSVDDRPLHKKIHNQMKNISKAICINKEYSASQLKGFLSYVDCAIGSRYHFCVFAAGGFTPFLGIASGIYQRTKLEGLAGLCEIQECYINMDMGEVSISEIIPLIDSFFIKKTIIKEQLIKIIPELEKRSLISINKAVEIINKNRNKL